jgi:hypothetical protein
MSAMRLMDCDVGITALPESQASMALASSGREKK